MYKVTLHQEFIDFKKANIHFLGGFCVIFSQVGVSMKVVVLVKMRLNESVSSGWANI